MSVGRVTRSSMARTAAPAAGRGTTNASPRSKDTSDGLKRTSKIHHVELEPAAAANIPATPPSKRARVLPSNRSPVTSTPVQVKVMATSYSTGGIDKSEPSLRPVDRPAEPHRTNATLKTPGGSCLVTYPREDIDSSPSKAGIPPATTTTGQLLEEACAHLIKVEPRLKPLIEKYPCGVFSPEGLAEEVDPFRSLTSGIMAQQVSGAATKSIKNKFVALFTDAPGAGDHPAMEFASFPTPAQVAACEVSFLRKAGLSERKAEYIKGLAEKFVSGELNARMLINASDDEVLERLTAVRGLGKWSVEMFACFGLKRMDVFSTGDLGVQRGMAALVGKDVKKLKAKGGGKWKYMAEQDMLDHSAKFAPYRSLFMWYMWRIEDVDVGAIQDK
ncbi:MAG: hypothetical protein LQ347_001329 [Umbilicaria vellea]|nr:MAG: hypothetical protein LQ347_001329 [Umbilicaria vellea]